MVSLTARPSFFQSVLTRLSPISSTELLAFFQSRCGAFSSTICLNVIIDFLPVGVSTTLECWKNTSSPRLPGTPPFSTWKYLSNHSSSDKAESALFLFLYMESMNEAAAETSSSVFKNPAFLNSCAVSPALILIAVPATSASFSSLSCATFANCCANCALNSGS